MWCIYLPEYILPSVSRTLAAVTRWDYRHSGMDEEKHRKHKKSSIFVWRNSPCNKGTDKDRFRIRCIKGRWGHLCLPKTPCFSEPQGIAKQLILRKLNWRLKSSNLRVMPASHCSIRKKSAITYFSKLCASMVCLQNGRKQKVQCYNYSFMIVSLFRHQRKSNRGFYTWSHWKRYGIGREEQCDIFSFDLLKILNQERQPGWKKTSLAY